MDLELGGRLALVTGSTAGIGLAITAALAREGAVVVIGGRIGPRVAAVLGEVRAAELAAELRGRVGDLATPDEIAAMATFLSSPRSAATNGAALREGGVPGGIR